MAVKDVTFSVAGEVATAVWAAGAGGDTGKPVRMAAYPDKTAQVAGDATGVAIQGSHDGTNWFALTDPAGETIDLAGATFDMVLVRENPLYIRPSITGGTSTVVIVVGV